MYYKINTMLYLVDLEFFSCHAEALIIYVISNLDIFRDNSVVLTASVKIIYTVVFF